MLSGPASRAPQALLAGGTFNGEVVLWDLGRDAAAGQDPQARRGGGAWGALHSLCDGRVGRKSYAPYAARPPALPVPALFESACC